MRIAITGALGHIGSRLIRYLPSALPDCELVLINHDTAERYYPLFDLPEKGNYRFVAADVREADLTNLFAGCSAVIHLASATRTRGGPPLPESIENQNVAATGRVARACVAAGASLIYVSTTAVYGTRKPEVDENCSAADLNPQSRYAQTKLREEGLLQAIGRDEGLRFLICRFGTIFGFSPGMRFDTAVNKFCWQATLGLPLTVWQTALDQMRPYLDVLDAVRALTFFLGGKNFDNGIYNVLTINTTVNQILSILRHRIPELTVEMVRDTRMSEYSYKVLTGKIEDSGFRFQGNLERGIGEVLDKLDRIRAKQPIKLRKTA